MTLKFIRLLSMLSALLNDTERNKEGAEEEWLDNLKETIDSIREEFPMQRLRFKEELEREKVKK